MDDGVDASEQHLAGPQCNREGVVPTCKWLWQHGTRECSQGRGCPCPHHWMSLRCRFGDWGQGLGRSEPLNGGPDQIQDQNYYL